METARAILQVLGVSFGLAGLGILVTSSVIAIGSILKRASRESMKDSMNLQLLSLAYGILSALLGIMFFLFTTQIGK